MARLLRQLVDLLPTEMGRSRARDRALSGVGKYRSNSGIAALEHDYLDEAFNH